MTNSPIEKWMEFWHQLLDDQDIPKFKDPDDMAGVLADFRRNPELLAKAIDPLPCSEELLNRITYCMKAETTSNGIYLVSEPIPASDDDIYQLVDDALQKGCKSCGIPVPNYPVNIHRRPMHPDEASTIAPLVEELGDLYIDYMYDSRGLESNAMRFLSESLYTLAASFEVQGYCLTPLCPDEIKIIDPYAPQVELWRRGAQASVRWKDDSADLWVDVFVES